MIQLRSGPGVLETSPCTASIRNPAPDEFRYCEVLQLVIPLCVKALTIKMPDELAARLEKRARRFGLSQSAIVRASLERELRRGGQG
jgi:Ribbon-helix-helix protein, copG family